MERRVGVAVDADDLGGDPLADLGLVVGSARITRPVWACMSMKPGQTTCPVASMVRCACDAVERAPEQPHPLALDADRAVVARIAGAVDDEAARDQEIEHGGPSGRQSITGSGPGRILTP